MTSNRNIKVHVVKDAAEIKLDGVSVTFLKGPHDSLRAVTFADAVGNKCRVQINSYALECLVPAPPASVKRFVLRATLNAVGAIERQYEHRHEAEAARDELATVIQGDASITEVDVILEEDDAGIDGVSF